MTFCVAAAGKGKKADNKEPIAIDDLTFHQCVRLGSFDTSKTIRLQP